MGSPRGGGLDPGPNIGEVGHDPAEFDAAELEQLTIGGAGRSRRAFAALDQRDLAEEAAGRHRADEPALALDPGRATHDDVERLRGLAFAE